MSYSALLMAIAVAAACASPSPSPSPSPNVETRCTTPNDVAMVVEAAAPVTPALAMQQGIQGTVRVSVSLDAASKVVGTRILSSPSTLLNEAALSAARRSKYLTAIRDCKPVPIDYILSVEFHSQ